jgi:hypothetical protein
MLNGWRAQQTARGLREDVIGSRERLMRRFSEFANEYPWSWEPSHVDEWSLSLTAEHHLARSTIRAYQCSLRLFNEFLCDSRYGWVAAKALRKRARTRARSCSGSSITPMSGLTAWFGRYTRVRWPPTGMPPCSR